MPPFLPPPVSVSSTARRPHRLGLLRALSFPPFPRLPSVTFGGDPGPFSSLPLIPRLSLSFPRAVSFTLALGDVRLRPRRHPLPKSSRETDCLAVKRQFIC